MAYRNYQEQIKTLQRDPVKLWARGVGAAAADLTGVVSAGGGVVSIKETGTGAYNVLLADKYNSLLQLVGSVIDAGVIDDWEVVLSSDLVSKTIGIQVFKGGAAADLPATATLLLEITLSNTARAS